METTLSIIACFYILIYIFNQAAFHDQVCNLLTTELKRAEKNAEEYAAATKLTSQEQIDLYNNLYIKRIHNLKNLRTYVLLIGL